MGNLAIKAGFSYLLWASYYHADLMQQATNEREWGFSAGVALPHGKKRYRT